MGGRGSGRRYGGKRYDSKGTTGASLPLDVRALHRAGFLQPGAHSSWRWWRDCGHEVDKAGGASIGCRIFEGGAPGEVKALLLYAHAGDPVRQSVGVLWTPCNFGGRRPWWQCPHCGRRVAVIYCAGKLFACRHCYRLCYTTQQENAADRALSRACKIRERLGQKTGGVCVPFPSRPKGMHWKTYGRLAFAGCAAEERCWGNLTKWLDQQESAAPFGNSRHGKTRRRLRKSQP